MQAKILGIFEQIDFPQFGIHEINAKVDSGAYRGALHCTKFYEKKDNTGKKRLHFSPFDYPEAEVVTEDYEVNVVKSSNGKDENRYFINTYVTLQGETYPICLSLADRSSMRWPVLIGRRFLQKNHFLVDVNLNKIMACKVAKKPSKVRT